MGEREKYRRLLASDCYVLSSHHEGFGIVLQEAMCAGLPIVATAHGGQRDVVQDGANALLVESNEPPVLAAAVHRLLADPALREAMSARNREKVQRVRRRGHRGEVRRAVQGGRRRLRADMAKLLIIGLDGADWGYVSDRLSAGAMPVLGRLAREGSFGLLRSTVPPVSCPAWPAMTTGVSPGNLGLFDLTVPDGYGKRTVSARDVAAPRLWDYVGANGGRSIIMNVPVTWPPRPIDGVLVGCLLTPQGAPYTCPREVGPDLERRFAYSPGHPASRRGKLRRLQQQADAFCHLLDGHPWDVAMLVFSVTDWAQHDHWADRAYIDRLFDEADAAVGRIIARAGAPNVAVISDHGFCGADRVLNMNRLLSNLGFLRYGGKSGGDVYVPNLVLRSRPGRGKAVAHALSRLLRPRKVLGLLHRLGIERAVDLIPNVLWQGLKSHMVVWDTPIDWPATRAYLYNALPQTVCMNVAGRDAAGAVAPQDYAAERGELISALSQTADPLDGGPVFASITPREEAFPGRHVDRAPDLVFTVRNDAYVVSPADHPSVVWRTRRLRGRHRSGGIYLLHGPAFRQGASAEARLLDMTPTLLCAAGFEPPAGVDGRVATDLLCADAGRMTPRRYDLHVTEAEAADADTASVDTAPARPGLHVRDRQRRPLAAIQRGRDGQLQGHAILRGHASSASHWWACETALVGFGQFARPSRLGRVI